MIFVTYSRYRSLPLWQQKIQRGTERKMYIFVAIWRCCSLCILNCVIHRVISEQWTGKKVEGSYNCLDWGTVLAFVWWALGKPRTELRTANPNSEIWTRDLNIKAGVRDTQRQLPLRDSEFQKGTFSFLRPASLSSGQGLWLLIMRSRVPFPVLPWKFFLAGKDSRGDHGPGS